jgi:hypothetical protein
MKMKKMIFLMLVFCMGITASMNAQVNIGSTAVPQPGAILDLSQGNQKLGLILPNVPLADVGTWQLDAGTGVEGTVVYNTNENLLDAANSKIGKGIFVWVGSGWQAAKSGAGSPLVLGFDLTPATDVVPAFVGGTIGFTASDFQPASAAAGVTWLIPSGSASIAAIQSSSITTCVVEGLSEGQATLAVTSLDGNVEKLVTIDFTCPTAGATLTSAAGTNAQNVAKETAITNITYSLTNAASATVTGLPDGVSYEVNSGVLTISGTTPAETDETPYSYTVKVTNVCGTETSEATGSITVTVPNNIGNYDTQLVGDTWWTVENISYGSSTSDYYATEMTSWQTGRGYYYTNHNATSGQAALACASLGTAWHLPDDVEWKTVELAFPTMSAPYKDYWYKAPRALAGDHNDKSWAGWDTSSWWASSRAPGAHVALSSGGAWGGPFTVNNANAAYSVRCAKKATWY